MILFTEERMSLVGRRRWNLLLALPFCFGTAVVHGQTSNQDLGQFQGQGDLFGDGRTNPHPSDLVDRVEFRG